MFHEEFSHHFLGEKHRSDGTALWTPPLTPAWEPLMAVDTKAKLRKAGPFACQP